MFLSSILNKTIVNKSGEVIGKVSEMVVARLNSPLPVVIGIVVSRVRKGKDFFIPVDDVSDFEDRQIRLRTDVVDFTPFQRKNDEVLLSRDILDKQIVDVRERQLTRINDLELSPSGGNVFIRSVDVSFRSLLNRLGIPTRGFILKYNTIPWQNIQFLGVGLPVKVKIDYERLETLHPADIARYIFRGPGYREGTQIIESLEKEIAADVIESLPLELQLNVMENMDIKSAAKILSQIESHHAADLLAGFDTARGEAILALMNSETAHAARELLTYPSGSAGAYMKVEYVTVPKHLTIEELYDQLRSMPKLPEFLLYFYVTESTTSRKLVGVVSVWELFKNSTRLRMEAIMIKNVITAAPLDTARSVLKKMTQYDLSAIPVVNKRGHILGIVTLTHAIEILVPKSWQTRVDWK